MPHIPPPPPTRKMKETFFGGLVETKESIAATKKWREQYIEQSTSSKSK